MHRIFRTLRSIPSLALFILGGCAMTGGPEPDPVVPPPTATTPWPMSAPKAGAVVRVLGESPAPVLEGENWFAGDCEIEAPLPVGYPPPTPPECVEIKTYPVVRRAEFSSQGPTSIGMGNGFWPLFNHIKKRDIAMTSPVEMDYDGMLGDDGKLTDEKGSWTMSFLYRQVEQGPTGSAERGVKVEDKPEVTVISIGLMGGYGINRVNQGLAKLQDALAKQDRWVAAGDPRSLSYNGPQIPFKRRWSEVQIPVKPRNAIASINPGSTR
jgi:hypothetical protein